MFGISWAEFLVIILVVLCVVPAKHWPDIAKFCGKVFKYIKNIIWKITDISEQIQHRVDLEKPIDDLIANATNDIFPKKSGKKRYKKVKNKK